MDLEDIGKLIGTVILYLVLLLVLNQIYVWGKTQISPSDTNSQTITSTQKAVANNFELITLFFPDGTDVVMIILDLLFTGGFVYSTCKFYT